MAFAELTDNDLITKVFETERQLVAARFKHSTNQLEDTSTLRTLRRDIARLKTEARNREVAQGLNNEALMSKHRPTGPITETPKEETAKGGFLSGIVDKIAGKD